MTPEEIRAAAVRPLIRNNEKPVEAPAEPPKRIADPVVRVEQRSTKVKVVGRSQYMIDMITAE